MPRDVEKTGRGQVNNLVWVATALTQPTRAHVQGLWHWELSILQRRFQLTNSAILPTAKDYQWKGEEWIPECPKVGTEHSLLWFSATPKEKRADWSPGRAFIDGPLLAKASYFPFWSLLRLSVLYLVFLASHITRTYWLAPENLSNLVNDNIYIILLFFQFLGSPKGKKKIKKVRPKGWRWPTFLLAEGRGSQVLPSSPLCTLHPLSLQTP